MEIAGFDSCSGIGTLGSRQRKLHPELGRLERGQRLDSIIVHEYEEHRNGMDHEAALRAAARTALPISDRAREIGEAMQKGWKGNRREV